MKFLTVATRGGALAIAQTEHVIASLKKIHPGLNIRVKKITTTGDKDIRTTLWTLKETGFFTSQVEDALLARETDFAVHSFKDLPTAQREGLTIGAVLDRNFVEDCLVAASPVESIEQLPAGAKVGTSSLRRAAQLKHLRGDLEPAPIRGNVHTRLRKLATRQFDAILLASAGLERLGLGDKISFVFDPAVFIPAPAQGALVVQTRADDVETNEIVAAIDDKDARITTAAERKILTTMHCGCHAPVGAYAKIITNKIKIRAFICDLQGESYILRQTIGPASQAEVLAEHLAKDLLTAGGDQILASLEK